jgi:hypothetical protein
VPTDPIFWLGFSSGFLFFYLGFGIGHNVGASKATKDLKQLRLCSKFIVDWREREQI